MFSFTLILNSSTILKPIWMGWTVPSGILWPCSVGRVTRPATGRSSLHRSLAVYVAAILQKLRKWENSFAFCNLILPGPAALDGTRKVSPPVWLDWDSVHSVGTMAEVVCDPTWHWIRKEDYNMKKAIKCSYCKKPIVPKPGEKTVPRLRALGKDFHPTCFKCEVSTSGFTT